MIALSMSTSAGGASMKPRRSDGNSDLLNVPT